MQPSASVVESFGGYPVLVFPRLSTKSNDRRQADDKSRLSNIGIFFMHQSSNETISNFIT